MIAFSQPLPAQPSASLQISRQPASPGSNASFSDTLAGVQSETSSSTAQVNAPVAVSSGTLSPTTFAGNSLLAKSNTITPGTNFFPAPASKSLQAGLPANLIPTAASASDSIDDLPAPTSAVSQLAATVSDSSGVEPDTVTSEVNAPVAPVISLSVLPSLPVLPGAAQQGIVKTNPLPVVRSADVQSGPVAPASISALTGSSSNAKSTFIRTSHAVVPQPQPLLKGAGSAAVTSDADLKIPSDKVSHDAADPTGSPAAGSTMRVQAAADPATIVQVTSLPNDASANQQDPDSTPLAPADADAVETAAVPAGFTADRAVIDPSPALPPSIKSASSTGPNLAPAGRGDAARRHKKAVETTVQAGVEQTDSVAAPLLALPTSAQSAGDSTNQNAPSGGLAASPSLFSSDSSLAAANCSPGSLAFAVKLQNASPSPQGAAAQKAGDAAAPGSQTLDSLNNAPLGKLEDQFQPSANAATGATPGALVAANQLAAQTPGASALPQPQDSSASRPASSVHSGVSETPSANSASAGSPVPVRALQVQIAGQDNQRVDLRLIERSGSLSLSVRTMDGNLTRALQEHLPDLTTKLAAQPAQTEWWTPDTKVTSSSNTSGNGSGTKDDSSGSQGQGNPTSQDQGRQQGGRQNNQPSWVDELAAIGNKNNLRREYIWHP